MAFGRAIVYLASSRQEPRREAMQPRIAVVVDDREVGAEVVSHLLANPACEIAIRHLPLGDYKIAGRLLLGRKRWPDLVASIADGRLFSQTCRSAASPLRTVLLLEGSESEIDACSMRRGAIQGALITVSIVLGIPVLRSNSAEESARHMLDASRQLGRATSGAIRRPGSRPKSKRRTQLQILQGLPVVGPARAARLLDSYGSLQKVVHADGDDLARTTGIGKSVAAKIRWAVTEPEAGAGYGECLYRTR